MADSFIDQWSKLDPIKRPCGCIVDFLRYGEVDSDIDVSITYCNKHGWGDDTEFFNEVTKVLLGAAREKGYLDKNLENPLMDFMSLLFPDHALGEIIYKAVRYKNKKDPLDLVKIAAWAKLLYEWRDKP